MLLIIQFGFKVWFSGFLAFILFSQHYIITVFFFFPLQYPKSSIKTKQADMTSSVHCLLGMWNFIFYRVTLFQARRENRKQGLELETKLYN